jgi:hypothetical protein
MRTIQQKMTSELEALFASHGLETVQVTAQVPGSPSPGRLLVMDGQDTRLSLRYSFRDEDAEFQVSGEAVDAGYPEFFKERNLFPTHLGRGHYEQNWRARYTDGARTRELFTLLADLLAPYAKEVPAP